MSLFAGHREPDIERGPTVPTPAPTSARIAVPARLLVVVGLAAAIAAVSVGLRPESPVPVESGTRSAAANVIVKAHSETSKQMVANVR